MAAIKKKKGEAKFLKPLKGLPIQKNILVYDIESKDGNTQDKGFTRPFLFGMYDGKEYIGFRNRESTNKSVRNWEERAISLGGCVDEFLRFVFKHPENRKDCNPEYFTKNADFWAHNGGRFDATYILVWLMRNREEFHTEIVSVHGRAQKIKVTPKDEGIKGVSWTFLDSALLMQMSLEKAAEVFIPGEMGKLKSFDLDTIETSTEWEHYNEIDCKVLYNSLRSFRSMVERLGGEMGMTAPATAMRLYRRRFQKINIARNAHFESCDGTCDGIKCGRRFCDGECHGCLHRFVRRGYYGGRTEIFEMTAPSGVKYYDLNSSYPRSMLEAMPVGDAKEVYGTDNFFDFHKRLSKNHVGFVECLVDIPATCVIPPLPIICDDRKLRFPTGLFSGVWDYDELMCIYDPTVGGKIVDVKTSIWFKKKSIFVDFVNTLYEYRKADDEHPHWNEALSELAKLMMNSLYGKFGMNEEREELLLIGPNDKWPTELAGKPLDGRHETCPVWSIPKYVKCHYIIPQISAHITALSRIRLWKTMKDIVDVNGQYRKKVYYSDTDSILTDATLPTGAKYELGAWKREYPDQILSGIFVLPKMYVLNNLSPGLCPICLEDRDFPCKKKDCKKFHTIVRMKGVGYSAQTLHNFKVLMSGQEVKFTRVEQHRTVLKQSRLYPRELKGDIAAKKSIRANYDKRIVLPSGETVPIHIVDANF